MPDDTPPSLTAGDALPFFDVVTVDGSRVAYEQLWQQRNVVLISLPSDESESDQGLVTLLTSLRGQFEALQTVCVRDPRRRRWSASAWSSDRGPMG